MTEDKILWTAQYVEGDLDEAERLEFENLLTQDEELKQYLADYYDIHSSLQMELSDDAGRNALLGTLQTLNREQFAAEQPKVVKLSDYLRWVSGVAAVLVLGMLIWAPWKGDLYEQYNTAPQMSVAERGAEVSELDKAAALFNAKKYNEAKVALEKLNTTDPANAMVAYYYGVSLLETNEVAKGRLLLEDLFKGQSVYKYDAAYAMAMSYLKEDKKADTKFWLEKIPDGAVQYEKAQKLLRKL
ncbi:MAG: hypothetical protein REI64_10330 [Pedobacter sp.]|uniref:hypothetical protein n=1 Tax=Pedobacter sp. TaxID=1411316 RepID=UPI002808CFD7|nr:hypothetical protein [Pedobacter sp.]MDQ8005185.1 hypothetical protein [Pedobacter sp.]